MSPGLTPRSRAAFSDIMTPGAPRPKLPSATVGATCGLPASMTPSESPTSRPSWTAVPGTRSCGSIERTPGVRAMLEIAGERAGRKPSNVTVMRSGVAPRASSLLRSSVPTNESSVPESTTTVTITAARPSSVMSVRRGARRRLRTGSSASEPRRGDSRRVIGASPPLFADRKMFTLPAEVNRVGSRTRWRCTTHC